MRSCCKCHKEIYDRFYFVADNRTFHFDCLTCEKCYNSLASLGTSYFAKDKETGNCMLLCRNDYLRMKTAICSGCQHVVNPDSYAHKIPCLPMNNNMNNFNEYSNWLIYHPSCLKCFKCQNFLRKGDKYILKPSQDGIVCLNNECANDFRISPINTTIINQTSAPTRKRGRNSNSVKVKAEKTQQQFNQNQM